MIDDLPPISERELALLRLSDRVESSHLARKRSRPGGRIGRSPQPLSAEQLAEAHLLREQGRGWWVIASLMHISEDRLRRELGLPGVRRDRRKLASR